MPLPNPCTFVATPGAIAAYDQEEVQTAMARFLQGHWGDIDREDQVSNDYNWASKRGVVLGAYHFDDNRERLWIHADFSARVITILLPSEY